ncbi:MAG TPA: aminomethyl-transferring glycine dehydrogenase subunit GcvPB [Chloroflexota bacterium]|nr:aminomethyl-transferring glycine dehydrogenase subunit GcvPB [Chloroflexota bacterium]
MNGKRELLKRRFHEAAWNEPVLMTMGSEGERGLLLPEVEPEVKASVGDPLAKLPSDLVRRTPPALPQISQPEILRHYMRLSQMTFGNNVSIDLGNGTCSMKYNPLVNERLARLPQVTELHPLQDDDTVQGMLEIIYRFEGVLKAISGLDHFAFQPGGGAHGVFTNALMIKAYHRARGEADQRTEIISTLFSHPIDAAAPATAGFKVITLYPGPNGYPEPDALRAAVSERTAGLMMVNPEDTGLYNPHVDEFVKIVHEAGGLCAYDQANANGILGIARAREAGFDLCQFNLHKTFGTPHGAFGLSVGAVGVRTGLEPFLPVPHVVYDGGRYALDYDRPHSIGTTRAFHGNAQTVLRAYAWVLSLGAEGLREVARTAVLNNNYLAKRLSEIPGLGVSYPENTTPRLEQIRYSWEKLTEETGVGTEDIEARTVDFGVQVYWTSHHPFIVPEPMTLEPTESFSKADLDEYAEILAEIAHEAYTDPEVVRTAPHRSTVARAAPDAASSSAVTWQAHLRQQSAAPAGQ